MNKWKISFFVCLITFISMCVLLVYNTIDLGVSYSYLEQSYDAKSQANEVLGNLIVKGGKEYSKKDFLYLLRQEYPEALIVEEGNKIIMDWNVFVFKGDKLIEAH